MYNLLTILTSEKPLPEWMGITVVGALVAKRVMPSTTSVKDCSV
jgi:hypothetical protein